jgi:LysR family transcriptional regulator, glycine cleavage system transcriptional activator
MRLLLRSVRQLQRLAVFEAVGRLGSFTAAAAELGMSQPAVSKQMKVLEGSLRTALFDRGRNRSDLTHDGLLLHQTVTEAFDMMEGRLSRLRGHVDHLRVAVQPSVAESWFAPHLGELRKAMEPTQLQLTIFDHDRELADIHHHVSIRFGLGAVPGLCSKQLVSEAVVPVASPELASKLGLTAGSSADVLLDAPLLHVDPTGRGWQDWPSWFGANGLAYTVPADAVVYPTYGSAMPLAISGNGVLLSWRTLMGDYLRRGLLLEVGPLVTRSTYGYFLHWPPALTRDLGFQRFGAWLVNIIARQA